MATDTRFSGLIDNDSHLTLVGGASSEAVSSRAVTFCGSEAGLLLESVSSTMTCVGWLTVADCRPGPPTWLV